MMEMNAPLGDIFKAAIDAGRQLVKDGKMSFETLNIVSRELMPLGMYMQAANQRFQQALEAPGK